MAPHQLHGTLLVTIYEIDKLKGEWGFNSLCGENSNPQKTTKTVLSHVKRFVLCRPQVVGSRVYATIDLDRAIVGRTRTIEDKPSNPRWYQDFSIYCAHAISNIVFTVKDDDPIGATLIGRAYLPVEEIIRRNMVDRLIEIVDEQKNPIHGGFKIHVKLQYFHVSQETNWSRGISTPEFGGVPSTFFPQRKGCQVTLYKDADDPTPMLPRCWVDIFDAINNAKRLIYIAGWSVYAEITLIRDPNLKKPGGNMTLGELLRKKADQGVNVLLLVWDDRTSVPEFKKDGLMATHDQDTKAYFQNTNVRCVLCPRNPDVRTGSLIQEIEISTMFTHHQKIVVVDSELQGSQKRRIVSFIGGIDLCNGRFDFDAHYLFRILDNAYHRNDFHQPNFPGSSIRKGGPREPWHDIHCQLEGPVAWDVLYSFEQRWKRQVGNQYLYSMDALYEFLVHPTTPVNLSDDPDTWNVQIFRSIDFSSASEFPTKRKKAAEIGLVSMKNNILDRSIQDAYINAIRRAKNFIYIENQYFLGSSYGWKHSRDITIENINALHLIPKELSLKIVSKIKAGERFSVYVVIPMWPEGIPESSSVQEILDWQRRTMEMMYTDISEALTDEGLAGVDLRDYLTFFCLGNREIKVDHGYVPPEKPDPDTDYSRAQNSRRFMIYVHSKMMIVDDEYIIIGSANINQRSMDGARDTEIAMGGFQPHHLAEGKAARGKIFEFRTQLWSEHLRDIYPHKSFGYPESLECIRLINQNADERWFQYASQDMPKEDLEGHLLRYPVNVSTNGEITALAGFEFFPDTTASVLGSKLHRLPSILTT